LDALFLARMEQLLYLYALPYDEHYPVVCFDERPCFLIGVRVEGLALKAGQAAREHYSYTKNGSCALLMAIEPKTGKRLARVYERRTKQEYAQFLKELAALYPTAEKIRLVQDNLNTHNLSSLYETFPAAEAFALAQRFAFYPTPKSGSWLNMIEIEFSALAKQCLHQRIPTQEKLAAEVQTIVAEREQKKIQIDWQFSIESARSKFNRHYQQVNAGNSMCSKT
jgi:recombinational DNA repair ATPase RecF